jgi:sulfur carrier protein ThiS
MSEIFEQYDIFKGKHAGSTAFVCGAGTSLNDVLKDVNYKKIYDHVVISVNSNILSHEWDKESSDRHFWISNDSAVLHWDYWNLVKKSKCNKLVRNSWEKYYDAIPPEFVIFRPRKNDKEEIKGDDGLCFTSSIPSAIDLAIQMGCKKIYLLGVDHYFLPNGKSHFWELWPIDKQPVSTQFRLPASRPAPLGMQKRVFKDNQIVYSNLSEWAEKSGVKIYNCSKRSAVKIFDKVDFAEII